MKKRIKITALTSILSIAIIGGMAIVPVWAADDNSKEDIEISFDIPTPDDYETYWCKEHNMMYSNYGDGKCKYCPDGMEKVPYTGQRASTKTYEKCEICGTEYKVYNYYGGGTETDGCPYKEEHEKTTYKCDRCGDVFDTEEALKNHKSNSKDCGIGITFPIPDEKETFKCDDCGKEFDTEEELKNHKNNSKEEIEIVIPLPDETYKCDKCGDEFETEEELKEHKNNSKDCTIGIDGNDWDFNCPNCGEFVMGYHECKNNYFGIESGDPNSKEDIEIVIPLPDDNTEQIAILETEVIEAERIASEARSEADRLTAIASEKRAELEALRQ